MQVLAHLDTVIYELAGKDGLARTGRSGYCVYRSFVKTAIDKFIISGYARL